MKLHFRLISVIFSVLLLGSCVKDEPFVAAYTVPPTFDFENRDSSGTARLIMMNGVKNYLSKGSGEVLDTIMLDSLWLNKGSGFSEALLPDFIYTAQQINNMRSVTLAAATSDADTTFSFADSVVANSVFFNRSASDGVAGTLTASQPIMQQHLFSKDGIAFDEVWYHAMLGAMALRNTLTQLGATGTTAAQAWNLAFTYTGLPADYDPSINYETLPLRRNRPLGIAAFFGTAAQNAQTGPQVFEAFRTGRAAIGVGDLRVSSLSQRTIQLNLEQTLVLAAISYLDGARQYTDLASRLKALSQAYGLVFALKQRSNDSPLTAEHYRQIRQLLEARFYTLVQDPAYADLTAVRNLLAAAYGL